jgi:hypothetical protein
LNRLAAGILAAGWLSSAVAGGFGEAELSNDGLAPTPVTLGVGSNVVQGWTTCPLPIPTACDQRSRFFDRDFWVIDVPAGHWLRSVIVLDYQGPSGNPSNQGAFFAVAKGGQIADLTSADGLYGTALVGGPVAPIGSDALVSLGQATFGGEGFGEYDPDTFLPIEKTFRLGPGQYTFWYQEAGGDSRYAFNFVMKPVPEPATFGLMAAGLALVGWLAARRRPARAA